MSAERLETACEGGWGPRLLFRELNTGDIAFCESGFTLPWYHYSPVMHGLVLRRPREREALVLSHVNWFVPALVALLSVAAMPLPPGWRLPTTQETRQDWRDEDADRYLAAHADCNGDGVLDEAKIVGKGDGTGIGLIAWLSSPTGFRSQVLDVMDGVEWLEVMGIGVAVPGTYKTACGKGYFDRESGDPKELTLARAAIDYFKTGSANSFFYRNDATGRFVRVWMSD